MRDFRTFAGSTALALLLAAGVASADVTPEQVWQSWQEYGATVGQTLTASNQTRAGDTLRLQDVRLHFAQEGARMEGVIPEVSLTQRGDGTVEVTMSPEFPLEMTVENEPTEEEPAPAPSRMGVLIRQPGLVAVASGEGKVDAMTLTAPTMALSVTSVDGVQASAMDLLAEMELSDLGASYRSEGTDLRTVTSDMTAAVAEMRVNATSPENGGKIRFNLSATDLKGDSSGRMLSPAVMGDLAAAMRGGANSTGRFAYGPATMEFDVDAPDGDMKGSASWAGGTLDVALADGSISYGGSTRNLNLTASGSQIPFPQLNAGMAEGTFQLLAPVMKAEAPQPFRFLYRIVDLKVSDELWGLFDPQAQLPREPATLVIDTKGTATVDVDLFDPVAVEQMAGAAPGKLNSLDVDDLKLTVAGAELTGKGGFTFDNSDTTTFGGMPAPSGKIDLQLVGANALIDRLVAIGLVPQDQAMGARMMLGMFARPGGSPDTMTSTLEFRDKGFFANGQRLQ